MACIVMPLYIYPLAEITWKPLYDAYVTTTPQATLATHDADKTRSITAHRNLDFLIIVNPNSGPGGEPLPSHDYVRELPKLNALPNVRTVGYLAIEYCRKP